MCVKCQRQDPSCESTCTILLKRSKWRHIKCKHILVFQEICCNFISKSHAENFVCLSVYHIVSIQLFLVSYLTLVLSWQSKNVILKLKTFKQIKSADAVHPAMSITTDFVVREFDGCKMLSACIYFLFYFVIGFVSS